MDDMDEYKKIYAEESAEHLNVMNDALLTLEKDAHNQETIHALFRAAHTLKGMSATMGYTSIAELTHQMENLMDMVKRNELVLDNESVNLLFECVDALEEMVNAPEDSIKQDISHLINKIVALSTVRGLNDENIQKAARDAAKKETSAAEVPAGAIPPEQGTNTFNVAVTLDRSCALKSARLTVILRNLSECGEIIGSNPPISELTQEKFDRDFCLTVSTKAGAKKIEDAVKNVAEVSKVEVTSYTAAPGQASGVVKGANAAEKGMIKNIQTVRVNVEHLDSMMDLVGELVINKIRLMQLASDYKLEPLEEALSSLDRLTNQLQDEVMFSRMVPLEQIFNRFPRMMRDLAKKEHKDIDLVIVGGEIELDRAVLDELGNPLVHILRNCVDHGIELPEDRKKTGKNPKGTIGLKAFREKNYVTIVVEDDGKGMNPGKFRQLAFENGVMTEDQASKLSDAEALNMAFIPGVTTSEKVTDISGRGVGLDVVKTKIEGLGGSVKLESTAGVGTRITLQLPITVAIIQSQMVKVGNNVYAIPITNVVRDVTIHQEQIKTVKSEEVVMIRNEVLPIVRLNKLFGVESNGSDKLVVVVVEKHGSNIGLVVDQLIGQQEVIIKNLNNRLLKGLKGFAGATILGDGNVALILDVGTLL